jgi:succinyl-CoA synthetase alpha subunit
MPGLVQLHKRNDDKGLVVIAAEVQGSKDEEIAKVINKNKAKFAVMKGSSGPKSFDGIPHAFVFDRKGKMVAEGHPEDDDFAKALKKAINDK